MRTKTKVITTGALLVAFGVVLSRFASLDFYLFGSYGINIGFGMLPILLLAVLYGPIVGCIGAVAWDVLGALIFPKGGFVIWFTLAAAMLGFIVGLPFRGQKPRLSILFIAITAGQVVYSVILNTLILHFMYGIPLIGLVIPRLIENAVMIVVNTAIVRLLVEALYHAGLVGSNAAVAGAEATGASTVGYTGLDSSDGIYEMDDIELDMDEKEANE